MGVVCSTKKAHPQEADAQVVSPARPTSEKQSPEDAPAEPAGKHELPEETRETPEPGTVAQDTHCNSARVSVDNNSTSDLKPQASNLPQISLTAPSTRGSCSFTLDRAALSPSFEQVPTELEQGRKEELDSSEAAQSPSNETTPSETDSAIVRDDASEKKPIDIEEDQTAHESSSAGQTSSSNAHEVIREAAAEEATSSVPAPTSTAGHVPPASEETPQAASAEDSAPATAAEESVAADQHAKQPPEAEQAAALPVPDEPKEDSHPSAQLQQPSVADESAQENTYSSKQTAPEAAPGPETAEESAPASSPPAPPVTIQDPKADSYHLSNVSSVPLQIGCRMYSSVETAFQASKFADERKRDTLWASRGPWMAVSQAQSWSFHVRGEWKRDQGNEKVLKALQTLKVAQYEPIKTFVLDTGAAEIVDASSNDALWCRKDPARAGGENKSGQLWMQAREQVRQQPENDMVQLVREAEDELRKWLPECFT